MMLNDFLFHEADKFIGDNTMKKSEKLLCDRANVLSKYILDEAIGKSDITKFIDTFHQNITWYSTGCKSVYSGINEVKHFVANNFISSNCRYNIIDQKLKAYPINDMFCYVCGGIKIKFSNVDGTSENTISRYITCIWCEDDGDLRLYHVHFSAQDDTPVGDILVRRSAAEENNILLKQKLQETSKTLEQMNNQLSILANNICGGVTVCELDEKFTIISASEGFFPLIGYSKDELTNSLSNTMESLFVENDLAHTKLEIQEQLKNGNKFNVEYRIRRKDGSVVTIMDNGVVLPADVSTDLPRVLSVLTDITHQKELETELKLCGKRYEVAMYSSDIAMFEYDVLTKDLSLFGDLSDMYGINSVIANGPETFVRMGIISKEYAADYLEMYRQIHSGMLQASCFVTTNDKNGVSHDYLLSLTNVFDDSGKPIRAIGVRKNVSNMRQLRQEQDYAKTMTAEQHLVYEVNVSRDLIINCDEEWSNTTGIKNIRTFSDLKTAAIRKLIAPEFHEVIRQKLSSEFIIEAYEHGQKVITFEYKEKFVGKEVQWHKQVVNIIKDAITGEIFARGYVSNIHNKKMKELKSTDDRKLYEAMLARATTLYEVNVTQDVFIGGHEDWSSLFGIQPTDCYSDMIFELTHKVIHPEDVKGFQEAYLRDNILKAQEEGKFQIVYDYRRPDKTGEFIWVRCTLHLYEDPQNNDVKGHSYLENINDDKCKEIQLIYNAEHDYLTTLYNKSATEKYITNFLESSEGKVGKHAYFIIDLDNFKSINDNFGHAFGDAVLSRSAANLKELFRDIDILGRIGGDEFAVLIKNISSAKAAYNKAKEICQKLFDSFNKEDAVFTVSASIGVALYPTHGKTYTELYQNSDTALYISKEKGRNRYTTYNNNMEPMVSKTNEIDVKEHIEPKVFESNIVEYVFKVIYETNNKALAISLVLELLGKHYNVSRAYIFEYTKDGTAMSNTFEWCNISISPQKDNLQDVPNDGLSDYPTLFEPDGIMLLTNVDNTSPVVRRLLEPQGIVSMLQFGIYKKDKFVGFIGFDECEYVWEPTKREITDLQSIANILSVFLQEMRSVEKINEMRNISMSIIHALDSYAYVCDPENFEILFINNKTQELIEGITPGCICYKIIRGQDQPCGNCPMIEMIKNGVDKYSMDIFNHHINICVNATSSWIDWIDGKRACLINSIDITRFKK